MVQSSSTLRAATRAIFVILFLAVALASCLSLGMLKGLNHDEHQFVTPPKLLVTKGLLPYRDCPQFHVPNLVFVNAGLFLLTDYVLLPARLFSVACGFGCVALVFFLVLNRLRTHSDLLRYGVATGAGLLLLSNPLFVYVCGRSWNHDLAMLLTLVGFALYVRAIRSGKPAVRLFFSGLLIGAAVTTRSSFAPLIVPFLGALAFVEAPRGVSGLRGRVVVLVLPHALGMLVGALPTLVLFCMAPQELVYSNLTYHGMEPMWRREVGMLGRLTLYSKLQYAKRIFGAPGNLLIALGFLAFAWLPTIIRRRLRRGRWLEAGLVWIMAPFLVLSALVPAPTFRQYLYALIPFLLLGLACSVAALCERIEERRWALPLFALIVAASCAYWPAQWRLSRRVFDTSTWYPIRAHEAGLELRRHVERGKVLTLAPLFPLEGGLDVYTEFATGPFAWRRSHLIPEHMRRKLEIVSPDELEALIENDPPAAILVGYEGTFGLEDPFIEYAERNGYTPVSLEHGGMLWIAPE